MSFDKQIQDKFSGFEPEVRDEQVDAGWEKIRYFLPPEEKNKRGFFFYTRKGPRVAATVVVIALFIGFLFIRNWAKTSPHIALQRISHAPRLAELHSTATPDVAFTQGTEKSPGVDAMPAAGSEFGSKRKSHLALTLHVAGSLPAIHHKTKRSASTSASQNTAFVKQAKPGTSVGLANTTAAPGNHNAYGTSSVIPDLQAHSSAATEFMMLLKQASLAAEASFAPEPEPMLLPGLERLADVLPNERRPALELFAGLNNCSLQLKAGQDKKTVQATGFSAGMAGVLPLRSKFYLSGQVIVCYCPVKYREEGGANAIIKKDVVPSVSSSLTGNKDTLIYYAPYTSTFELESNSAFHFSGGVGYQLFNRGRLSLDGTLLLNAGWMRLSYRTGRVNSDTGVFVTNIQASGANATSFYESVEKSPAPESVSRKTSLLSFGVSPSFNLAYQLHRNTALVFRPAYMIQLSPNALEANGKSYRLKENNWFIHLGLRWTF